MYQKKQSNTAWNKAREEKMKEYDCLRCPLLHSHCNPMNPCKKKKYKKSDECIDDWI